MLVAAVPPAVLLLVSCPATYRQIARLLLCTGEFMQNHLHKTQALCQQDCLLTMPHETATQPQGEVSMIALMLRLGLQPHHSLK